MAGEKKRKNPISRLNRRSFLAACAVATSRSLFSKGLTAAVPEKERWVLVERVAREISYLTPLGEFRMLGRGSPPPYKLSREKRKEVGLTPETWYLEVVPDTSSGAVVENPLCKERGNALSWKRLMALAEKHAIRFLHIMSCTNGRRPFGMGLWEGVPLREVIRIARPRANVRRVYYWGYHNNDPKQKFQASLSLERVLEEPPEELPVILCYKLNGKFLTPKGGAPVRMFVPGLYGNRSVKWLQKIVLTNDYKANDTYAGWNNDVESHLKTWACFLNVPKRVKAGEIFAVSGIAQVGMSGLKKVQCWLSPKGAARPAGDPYFQRAPWKDACLLGPPENWGGGLPGGKLPPGTLGIDPASGKPEVWPMRWTAAYWVYVLRAPQPGEYVLRCRTIDCKGRAQPLPRPYRKSGYNAIQAAKITVVSEA